MLQKGEPPSGSAPAMDDCFTSLLHAGNTAVWEEDNWMFFITFFTSPSFWLAGMDRRKLFYYITYYWKIMGAEFHRLFPISEIKDADLTYSQTVILRNRLSLNSKPQDSIIFLIIWSAFWSQHSILHDLFAWKNSRCSNNCGSHSTWISCS